MRAGNAARHRIGCLVLLAIVAFSFYIALIPNIDYPYPVHIDEWQHMAESKALLERGHMRDVSDPFSGIPALSLGQFEVGFHMFWGVLHETSGLSWLAIVRYFPSVIFVITVLSVYCLARRQGFGYEAAFITCLIPTTVGILGPAFLVPVAMGLLLIPLALFVAFSLRTGGSYILLLVLACALLWIHPPSAIAMIIVLLPFILLNLRDDLGHSLRVTLCLAAPCLVAFLAAHDWIMVKGIEPLFVAKPLPPYHDLPELISAYGYIPGGLCILGALVLGIRAGTKNIGLILGLAAMGALVAIYYAYGYGHQLMYLRGLLYMMLMMGIVGGAGLMGIKNLRLPSRLRASFVMGNIGTLLCFALVIVILVVTIGEREDTPYYHMIDEQEYRAFVWIGDNLNEGYHKAILDPWKATAFAALTSKDVYTRIAVVAEDVDREAYAFLTNGCADTDFLRRNAISIVYSEWTCTNPDLEEVAENVYVFREVGNQ